MKPVALDEYPVHQTPMSMARVASSDKNYYDRNYFNAMDRTGDRFLVMGLGVYPNLGVIDAFAAYRSGDRQQAVRFSDAYDAGSLRTAVGGYRIEVVEPLQRLRVVCEHDRLSFDLAWDAAFPAVLEEHHTLYHGPRQILDATRFAQLGSWSGTISIDGQDLAVDPQLWMGSRDRSWGIRPVGDPDPGGRLDDEQLQGHWWTYIPLRFDDFALVVIAQEDPDGYRTLNHATRVYPDGRIEQLGWPRIEVAYKSGTREPASARLHLSTPAGEPLLVEVETLGSVPLTVGCGYGGDPDWQHGQWAGRGFSSHAEYDMADPAIRGRLPYSTVDHVARATCGGRVGYGMFEHANMGRHDPSGFTGWMDMAD